MALPFRLLQPTNQQMPNHIYMNIYKLPGSLGFSIELIRNNGNIPCDRVIHADLLRTRRRVHDNELKTACDTEQCYRVLGQRHRQ